MSIPFETILAMLAIEMFRSLAPADGMRLPSTTMVVLATQGWIVFSYVLALALARRIRRRLGRSQGSTVEILEDYRFRLVIQRVVLVAMCLGHIYVTKWPAYVQSRLGLPEWSVLDDVLAITPFVGALAAGWVATYRADKLLSRRSWGMAEYVWFQARYSLLLVLLPWLVLKGLDDSKDLWPARLRELSEHPAAQGVFLAALLAAAAVFVPAFLRWLFKAAPMPPSELRIRLEALCRRSGLRFRDILIWRMERARILNAAVMGVVPRFRYVLFSDALLDALAPEECEAVLAHEIGHSKYRHVLIYLVFTLGFAALSVNLMVLLPSDARESFLIQMPILAVLVAVYFRVVFGFLSRKFERQADVYSLELMGTPVPLVLALEKIALMAGDIRDLGSWRHYSVAERVRYLSSVGYDSAARLRYHRLVGWVVRAVAAGVVVLFAGTMYLTLREPAGIDADIHSFEAMAAQRPWDYHAWMRLGELRAAKGERDRSRDAFLRALEQKPREARALAGLKALRLSEAQYRRTLAAAYAGAGMAAEAVADARRAVEAAPGDAEVYLFLAGLHLDRSLPAARSPEEAARLALVAQDIQRAGAGVGVETYEVLARAYLDMGRYGAAEAYAAEGRKKYPESDALKALFEASRRPR